MANFFALPLTRGKSIVRELPMGLKSHLPPPRSVS